MTTRREAIEYFIVAKLMSVWAGEGRSAYQQCKDYLLPDMFANKKLRWVYGIICEMYEAGWESTCEDDIGQYIIGSKKAPAEKVGNICSFLIEVHLQFCGMTKPITGVEWTVEEAINELIRYSDEQ